MVKLYDDTPQEFTAIIKRIDFDKIPKAQHGQKLTKLAELATKFRIPPRKPGQGTLVDVNIDIPQVAADFINGYYLGGFGPIVRKIAVKAIENYLTSNRNTEIPLKR